MTLKIAVRSLGLVINVKKTKYMRTTGTPTHTKMEPLVINNEEIAEVQEFVPRAITRNNEALLDIFERKVLRNIFGAVNENGQWRRRYNL